MKTGRNEPSSFTACANCGESYIRHAFYTNECPESLAGSFNVFITGQVFAIAGNDSRYSEAITKASQTADLFIRDLQEAHVKSPNVATEILLLDYIARTRAIEQELKRLATEKNS